MRAVFAAQLGSSTCWWPMLFNEDRATGAAAAAFAGALLRFDGRRDTRPYPGRVRH